MPVPGRHCSVSGSYFVWLSLTPIGHPPKFWPNPKHHNGVVIFPHFNECGNCTPQSRRIIPPEAPRSSDTAPDALHSGGLRGPPQSSNRDCHGHSITLVELHTFTRGSAVDLSSLRWPLSGASTLTGFGPMTESFA